MSSPEFVIDSQPPVQWNRVLATNSTAASFAAKIATATEPAGAGVLGAPRYTTLNLLFFGAGADNDTFDARVIGWFLLSDIWVPMCICQVACTLSTLVGVAAKTIINTDRLVDTITISNGVAVRTDPVANSQPALLMVPLPPCDRLEVIFDLGAGTDANALYAFS